MLYAYSLGATKEYLENVDEIFQSIVDIEVKGEKVGTRAYVKYSNYNCPWWEQENSKKKYQRFLWKTNYRI